MNIFALHDAALVARLAGADRPLCSELALSKDDPSNVLFSFVDENPLAPGWLCDLELPGDCIASWSGTLAFGEDERFAAHPHNWMSPGSEALDRLLGEIEAPIAKSGKRFCLIPHARHVLSDVQGDLNNDNVIVFPLEKDRRRIYSEAQYVAGQCHALFWSLNASQTLDHFHDVQRNVIFKI